LIEDHVLMGEKIQDPSFSPDETVLNTYSKIKLNPEDVDWIRIPDLLKTNNFYFFSMVKRIS